MMIKHLLVFLFLFTTVSASEGTDVGNVVATIKNGKLAVSDLLEDANTWPGASEPLLTSNHVPTASSALMACWLVGDRARVELTWWRSKSPALRTLAAALLEIGRNYEIPGPLLEPGRFNEEERNERMRELQLVEKYERQLGSAIKTLVEETYKTNPSEWKGALRDRYSAYDQK